MIGKGSFNPEPTATVFFQLFSTDPPCRRLSIIGKGLFNPEPTLTVFFSGFAAVAVGSGLNKRKIDRPCRFSPIAWHSLFPELQSQVTFPRFPGQPVEGRMDGRIDAERQGAAEPSSISSTLLDQLRVRQPEAWQRLVYLYGPVVYRWCRQLGVAKADAADVVQEVFAAVAAGAAGFHRDRPEHSFGAWIRTIARNKVYDHFRRRRGCLEAEGGTAAQQRWLDLAESADGSLSLDAPLAVDAQFVRRALEVVRAEFEARTWDAFWRIVVDGQSPAEVAAATGLSLAAVYQAKSRVMRRLRREVKESKE
jgi:RNA polymerase sigma-70 factor (ECF subfamily)